MQKSRKVCGKMLSNLKFVFLKNEREFRNSQKLIKKKWPMNLANSLITDINVIIISVNYNLCTYLKWYFFDMCQVLVLITFITKYENE